MPNPTKKRRARSKTPGETKKAAPPRKARAAKPKRTREKKAPKTLLQIVAGALDDTKALDIRTLDVQHLTTVTDTMVIASGRSDRQVRAIAAAIVEQCKKAGYRPLGVEGERSGEWILVDLGGVVVHVMLPRVREFYNLEKLWDLPAHAEVAEAE